MIILEWFSLVLHKNIHCECLLNVPWWGTSNEYPQRFLLRNKKSCLRIFMKCSSLTSLFEWALKLCKQQFLRPRPSVYAPPNFAIFTQKLLGYYHWESLNVDFQADLCLRCSRWHSVNFPVRDKYLLTKPLYVSGFIIELLLLRDCWNGERATVIWSHIFLSANLLVQSCA